MKYISLALIALGVIFLLVACGSEPYANQGQSQRQEASNTEGNQLRLLASNPNPQLSYSLERENLSRQLELWNDPNKVSYVTLLSDYGQIIATFVIEGKVSSLNSMLTTPDQIVDDPFGDMSAGGQVVASPDLDGSYGENMDGAFFFTTDGTYVAWNGKILITDRPMSITIEPVMIYNESVDKPAE